LIAIVTKELILFYFDDQFPRYLLRLPKTLCLYLSFVVSCFFFCHHDYSKISYQSISMFFFKFLELVGLRITINQVDFGAE